MDSFLELGEDFIDPLGPNKQVVAVHEFNCVPFDHEFSHLLNEKLKLAGFVVLFGSKVVLKSNFSEEMLASEGLSVDSIRNVSLFLVKPTQQFAALVNLSCFVDFSDLVPYDTVFVSECKHFLLVSRIKQIPEVV